MSRKGKASARRAPISEDPQAVLGQGEQHVQNPGQLAGDEDTEIVEEVGYIVGRNASRTRFEVTRIRMVVGGEIDTTRMGAKAVTAFMADMLEADQITREAIAEMTGASGYVG